MHIEGHLGRREPTDWRHVERYPVRHLDEFRAVDRVEEFLRLPYWHKLHDQGREGSCVGHAVAMERAITNTAQNRGYQDRPYTRRYDPLHIWNEAKKIDPWPDTNPGDDNGTATRSGFEVVRDQGARRIKTKGIQIGGDGRPHILDTKDQPDPAEGISTFRWCESVDEMRAALALGLPVVIGVNWYSNFDRPEKDGRWWWIGRGDLGYVRGGHAVCIYAASDRRQAFRVKNSWGGNYPLVWLPYGVMDRLLDEWGEAAVATDR